MNPASVLSVLMSLFSVLLPTKMWYAPNQPITVKVESKAPTSLVLQTFEGKPVEATGSADVPADAAEKGVDVKAIFPALGQAGTYVLFAVPKGKTAADFMGTPLVIEIRANAERGGTAPMVTHVLPLQYEVMSTTGGKATAMFYYDTAPLTVESFVTLSGQGYFDGLTFHRVIDGFMIQGGDPEGSGMGGPGYNLKDEFNARPHLEGVLSMAHSGAPDSAGSQFFICLDYTGTKQLDLKYTTFGRVVEGMDAVKKIGSTPVGMSSGGEKSKPLTDQMLDKAEVFPVTPGHNPYAEFMHLTPAK